MNRSPLLSPPIHHPSRFCSGRAKVPRGLVLVLVIGLGTLAGMPAQAQPSTQVAGLDPERDLKVSFSTDFEKEPDAGYVFGKITNSSSSTYPCVHLEFQLYSRSEDGASRASGTFGTDVNNVRPRSVTQYRARLDSPVSLGLKSVTVCRPGHEQKGEPAAQLEIVSFRAEPRTIDPGDWVKLYWEVKGAQQVRLYDDHGELESRIELPSGQLGWPFLMEGAQQENLHQPTKFTLVASKQGERVSKSFQVTVGGKEACAKASVALCRSQRAGCSVVHAVDGSSSEVCRWSSIGTAAACQRTAGLWTTRDSRYAKLHPDAVPRGAAAACITEVSNLR